MNIDDIIKYQPIHFAYSDVLHKLVQAIHPEARTWKTDTGWAINLRDLDQRVWLHNHPSTHIMLEIFE